MEPKREILKRFISNKSMAEAVYQAILDSFLLTHDTTDIHYLAAERISVEKLKLAWKQLERYGEVEKKEGYTLTQVGM